MSPLFVAIYVKAVLIGTDFKLNDASSKALMAIFSAYVAIAAVALLLRVRRYQVLAAGRRKREAAKALAAEADDSASAE